MKASKHCVVIAVVDVPAAGVADGALVVAVLEACCLSSGYCSVAGRVIVLKGVVHAP